MAGISPAGSSVAPRRCWMSRTGPLRPIGWCCVPCFPDREERLFVSRWRRRRYLDKLPEQIDISDTPDLLPPLALYAALRPGRDTRFTHAAFLRRKESDRLTAVSAVLNALGASAEVQPDGLVIHGVSALHGGDVSACGDHRIALLAGCAAMVADGPVTLSGAETVAKSYPAFWRELAALGGNWEVLES